MNNNPYKETDLKQIEIDSLKKENASLRAKLQKRPFFSQKVINALKLMILFIFCPLSFLVLMIKVKIVWKIIILVSLLIFLTFLSAVFYRTDKKSEG